MVVLLTNFEYLIPVITGTLLFGLLTVFIIYFILIYRKTRVKLNLERERLKQELLRVENEVKEQTLINVSRELHDNLGQIASLIKINLNMMSKEQNKEDTERVNDSLILVKGLIGDIKSLSASLRGDKIRNKGWINLIREDIERVNKMEGLHISFEYDANGELEHEKEVILYRITQEIVNNTLKHAKATEAKLSIFKTQNELHLHFSDNGIGFVSSKVIRGSGLTNIEDRCEMIGAILKIKSQPTMGTEIQISLSPSEKKHE